MVEEQAILEHDWLIAQFTVASGAVLAFVFGTALAIFTGQIDLSAGITLSYVGVASLAYIWDKADRRSRTLRQALKENNAGGK